MSSRRLPPGRPWPQPGRVVQVLGRDLAIGTVLWASRSAHASLDIVAGLACLVLAVLGGRWFGLSTPWLGLAGPQPWAVAWKEGALLFIGGACVANLLRLAFGAVPWFGPGPA